MVEALDGLLVIAFIFLLLRSLIVGNVAARIGQEGRAPDDGGGGGSLGRYASAAAVAALLLITDESSELVWPE